MMDGVFFPGCEPPGHWAADGGSSNEAVSPVPESAAGGEGPDAIGTPRKL
jgi:hypothetical protein